MLLQPPTPGTGVPPSSGATDPLAPNFGRPVALPPSEPCAVSPSQLISKRRCSRYWGFQKLLNMRHDSAPAVFGRDVHGLREAHLQTGEPIDQTTKAGIVASTGLHQIPSPGNVIVEREFAQWLRPRDTYRGDGGLYWGGIIDMLSGPGFPREDSAAFLGDHKTTGDLKWAKSETELRSDPQWNVYVEYFFQLTGLDSVPTLWHYITTKKPFVSKPVWVEAKRDDQYRLAIVDQLKNETYEIENIRRAPPDDVNDLEPNLSACRDFGGCPYQGGVCRVGLGTFFGAPQAPAIPVTPVTGATKMSAFDDRIAAMRAPQTSAAVAPTSAGINPPPDNAPEAARRPPGRPPGARNKPKDEPTGAITNGAVEALALDLGPIVEALAAIAAEQRRHNAEMEKHASAANEIAMATLEASAR
jgi:hypothetical protein